MNENIFRYGILVKSRKIDEEEGENWRIVTIGPTPDDSSTIIAPINIFDFTPKLGDCVKIKLKITEEDEEPIGISRETQWIRDVQVIDDTVVIFAFVHFDERSLRTIFVTTDGFQEFYVFQNPRSDFSMIAIPKKVVDETLRNRSIYQRQTEDIVYRVGLQYKRISLNPSKVDKLFRIRWCHYQDTQLAPVLERSSRESTLPFIDEAMVYGAIEGIVIAKNELSSLIWTPSMGCMQMSLAAFPTLRPLGDVVWVPPRRCLPENSFNFPCHYELFHDSKNNSWPDLKVIVDDRTEHVYIEGEGTCTKLKENEDKFGVSIPHIGVVTNGLEKYQSKMAVGMIVYVRLGFEQLAENEPYDIVVKEVTMPDDLLLDCRIVRVSVRLQKCWAILDPNVQAINRFRYMIDFVEIPSHVLWCSKKKRVDDPLVAISRIKIRLSSPTSPHSVCRALNVMEISRITDNLAYAGDFRFFGGFGWFRKFVDIIEIPMDNRKPIVLLSQSENQIILDPLRLCELKRFERFTDVAVNAQCVLQPGNVPTFVVRHVAKQLRDLPPINMRTIQSLPSARVLFSDEDTMSISDKLESDSSTLTDTTLIEERFSQLICPSPNRSFSTDVVCESMISEELSSTIPSEDTIPLILNEEETQHAFIGRQLPSWAMSSSSSASLVSVEASSLRPSRSGAENRIQSYRRVRGKDIRLGIRCWHSGIRTYADLLDEIVYRHQMQRPMFAINEHDVMMAWRRKPRGDILKMKQRRVTVIAVEKLDSRERFRTNRCEYESLVRFYVRSTDVAVVEKSVVIPVGGIYSPLPDDFVFGAVYTTMHLSSPLDPIPRIMGFGRDTGRPDFMPSHGVNPYQNNMVMRNHKGREWLRIQVNCNRPTIRKLRNNVFEIWKSLDISGLVIAEIGEMTLDELEPEIYEAYEMSCIIEPVAGGPFCITEIIAEDDDAFFANEENLIFWRVVTDLGKDEQKYKPHCVKKRKHCIVEEPPLPPDPSSRFPVGRAQHEILKFAQEITDDRVDRLRRLGDHRVRLREGPELAPQLEARKISIPERRDVMLNTFDYLKVTLHFAHEKGLWTDLTYEMLTNQINEYRAMNDNNHEHNMTKRKRSLRRGCDYLMNLVSGEGVVVNMHVNYGEKVREILERIVSSLAFNRTFVKKTEQANNVFTYCYQKNLIELD